MAGADFRGLLLICLLILTLNKKSVSHSLQFSSMYHVFLDSLWPQIRDHTPCNLGPAALYYTAVELEKNVTHRQRTDRQRTENREQRIEKPITEATLLPYQWNAGLNETIYKYYIAIYWLSTEGPKWLPSPLQCSKMCKNIQVGLNYPLRLDCYPQG